MMQTIRSISDKRYDRRSRSCSGRAARAVGFGGASIVAALILGLGGGCGGTAGNLGTVGGESHFLQSCGNSDCDDGLECISGLCTRACTVGQTSCGDLSPLALCTNQSVDPGAVAVCDVECMGSADCQALGTGYTCSGGFCRAGEAPDLSPTGNGGAGGEVAGNGGAGAVAAGGGSGGGSGNEVSDRFDGLTLTWGGGGGPAPPPGSDCNPSSLTNIQTLDRASGNWTWQVCEPSPLLWRMDTGSRLLTEAELGAVTEAFEAVSLSSEQLCRADSNIVLLDVRIADESDLYVDDTFSACPWSVHEGRTFIAGLDRLSAVFSTFTRE